MMRKIAIGLAAATIATASSTLTASALPGGGTLGVANSGGDGFTTVGFGRGGFGRGGFGVGRGFRLDRGVGPPRRCPHAGALGGEAGRHRGLAPRPLAHAPSIWTWLVSNTQVGVGHCL